MWFENTYEVLLCNVLWWSYHSISVSPIYFYKGNISPIIATYLSHLWKNLQPITATLPMVTRASKCAPQMIPNASAIILVKFSINSVQFLHWKQSPLRLKSRKLSLIWEYHFQWIIAWIMLERDISKLFRTRILVSWWQKYRNLGYLIPSLKFH